MLNVMEIKQYIIDSKNTFNEFSIVLFATLMKKKKNVKIDNPVICIKYEAKQIKSNIISKELMGSVEPSHVIVRLELYVWSIYSAQQACRCFS